MEIHHSFSQNTLSFLVEKIFDFKVDSWGIPGQIDQRLTPSYFKKNLKLGLWGSLTR